MSEGAQLLYVKLILIAAETYNKIPKNPSLLRQICHSKYYRPTIFESFLAEVKLAFPKFKETEDYYFFEEFEQKTNFTRISEKEAITKGTPLERQRNAFGTPKYTADKNKRRKEKEGRTPFSPPTIEEIKEYCLSRNNKVDPTKFYSFYESKGWMVGKNKMVSWRAAVHTWEGRDNEPTTTKFDN